MLTVNLEADAVGIRADRPLASDVEAGFVYLNTDIDIYNVSDETTWLDPRQYNAAELMIKCGILSEAGMGSVAISGSPSSGQVAEWASGTAITGVTVTGTGSYVKGTSPTFTTSIITPLIIGGSGVGSDLVLQATSGVGDGTETVQIKAGDNGNVTVATFDQASSVGMVGIGATPTLAKLQINHSGTAIRDVFAIHNITGDLGAASTNYAPLQLQVTASATNPSATTDKLSYGILSTFYSGVTAGGVYGQPVVGTMHGLSIAGIVGGAGHSSNESAGIYNSLAVYIGTGFTQTAAPAGGTWLGDWSLYGPIDVQPRNRDGLVIFTNNYYNGAPSLNPDAGVWVVTKNNSGPIGAVHAAANTYPAQVGIGIVGNSAAGTLRGFEKGLQIGGFGSPWMQSGTSRMGIGIDNSEYDTYGLYLHDRTAASSALSLQIDSDAGPVRMNVEIGINIAALGLLHVGGTYTTANAQAVIFQPVHTSSVTTTQYGVTFQPQFAPSGGSLTNAYGFANIPRINSGSPNITTYIGILNRIDTATTFANTITTGYGFQNLTPALSGSNPITTYAHLQLDAVTNGNGNTSGTVTNYGIRIGAFTAAAGSGGTIVNTALHLTLPTGAGAGTNTNKGLYITGNGAGTTNYALYSDSTAPSRFTGSLIAGSAALATDATDGFLYIPTCAGTPTGVPTTQTGTCAIVFDTTNNKLYIYDGSWLGGTTPGAFV